MRDKKDTNLLIYKANKPRPTNIVRYVYWNPAGLTRADILSI